MSTLKVFGLVSVLTLGVAAPAFAAPPPSVVGVWNGFSNQTPVRIIINTQAAAGTCRAILGTMQNVPGGGASTVSGWYCPATGRISFQRRVPATDDAIQAYLGNIGDDAAVDRMSGTFSAYPVPPGGGVPGEYSFNLSR
jgi:hypothetical protein